MGTSYHEHINQEVRVESGCWISIHFNEDRETVILDFYGGHTSSMHHVTKKDLESLRDHINAVLPMMHNLKG